MRQTAISPVLAVRAIGGLHVVTLAWDFVAGQDAKQTGLLGFAIERSELADGQVVERYFLRGIKRFKFKDEGCRLARRCRPPSIRSNRFSGATTRRSPPRPIATASSRYTASRS